jgi:hypothetical protein
MDLLDIQPSQLYINSQKLNNVMKWFNPKDFSSYEALPVKNLNGRIIFTDGHTRAYAAYSEGISKIKVYWDEDDLSWDAYQICVNWCNAEGIFNIENLKNRILEPIAFDTLWIDKCKKMQKELGIK